MRPTGEVLQHEVACWVIYFSGVVNYFSKIDYEGAIVDS